MPRLVKKKSKSGGIQCPTCDVVKMTPGWPGRKVLKTRDGDVLDLYHCRWCGCRAAVARERVA